MSFQQPASSSIRQYHFRDKAYTFPVESVMAPEYSGGQLAISVTDGYALTTSFDDSPQDQHTFDYVKQPDGSWLAHGTVTLLTTASALLSGTVTLRDPMGDMLRMAIYNEPTLFIDDAPIFFDTTKPGKSAAALLTIRQQGAITPVSLQVDPVNAFTVADAKMAFITTIGLSLTPSYQGANVIINYAPKKAGKHVAHLVVTTPYSTKTIPLMGQTGGLMNWLPTLPTLAIPTLSVKRSSLFTLPALRRSHQLSAFAFSVVVGLVWGSYILLSQSKTTIDLAVLAKQPAKITHQLALASSSEPKPMGQSYQDEVVDEYAPNEEAIQTQPVNELHLPAESKRVVSQPEQTNQPESDAVGRTTLSKSDQDKQTAYAKPASVRLTTLKPIIEDKPGLIAQTKPSDASSETMSDLEKELNSPVYHKSKP